MLSGLILGPRRLRLRIALWLGLAGVGWMLFKFAGAGDAKLDIAQEAIGLACAMVCMVLPLGWLLRRRLGSGPHREMVENISSRIRAWWVMAFVFGVSVMSGSLLCRARPE